ncbi:MAG: hypothetical protein U0271_45680 [Polyangiaceae bacterium]
MASADVPNFQFEPCTPRVQAVSGAECVACQPGQMHLRPDEPPDATCADLGEKQHRHLRCFTTGRSSLEVWCDGPPRSPVDAVEYAGPLRYSFGVVFATVLALMFGGIAAWLWLQGYIARSHDDD